MILEREREQKQIDKSHFGSKKVGEIMGENQAEATSTIH
jgi:hypothetical protein